MRRPTRSRLLLATTVLAAACANPATTPSPALEFRDLDGRAHTPLRPEGDAVHVLVFTSHECPIANGYAPTLQALHRAWQQQPRVRLFLVHVDPDLTETEAREHAAAYQLPGAILLDPRHQLVGPCGATITPEAVVRTAAGQMYRGRIDDQWRKLGSRAPAASQNDLADAVTLVLAGRPPHGPHPKAVGCLLPEPRN